MSSETQLNNLSFYVNGSQYAYEADSLSWKDGFGEYLIRNAVVGGGQTMQIFSEDIKTKFGMVKVSIPTTVNNTAAARDWKTKLNKNTIEILGTIDGQPFSRIFTDGALLSDPEPQAATEGSIELEFSTTPSQ